MIRTDKTQNVMHIDIMFVLSLITCAKEKDINATNVMMKTFKYMVKISEKKYSELNEE